jgi:hypothetical protein
MKGLIDQYLGEETPRAKLRTAQAILGLAFRLNVEVQHGRIQREIYEKNVTILTGGEGVRLPAYPEGTKHDLILGMHNLVLMAIGATALTADEVLEQVFGKQDKEVSRQGLRAVVNQVRNAFAHSPWRPKWLIKKHLRQKYEVHLGDLGRSVFDATTLDGQQLKPEDFGGLEAWVNILQYCEQIVPDELFP